MPWERANADDRRWPQELTTSGLHLPAGGCSAWLHRTTSKRCEQYRRGDSHSPCRHFVFSPCFDESQIVMPRTSRAARRRRVRVLARPNVRLPTTSSYCWRGGAARTKARSCSPASSSCRQAMTYDCPSAGKQIAIKANYDNWPFVRPRSARHPAKKQALTAKPRVSADNGDDHAKAKEKARLSGLLEVGGTGLEPVTPSLSSWCSPN
jgi:hypothetical protein